MFHHILKAVSSNKKRHIVADDDEDGEDGEEEEDDNDGEDSVLKHQPFGICVPAGQPACADQLQEESDLKQWRALDGVFFTIMMHSIQCVAKMLDGQVYCLILIPAPQGICDSNKLKNSINREFSENGSKLIIKSRCPSILAGKEKFHCNFKMSLAELVSLDPMEQAACVCSMTGACQKLLEVEGILQVDNRQTATCACMLVIKQAHET